MGKSPKIWDKVPRPMISWTLNNFWNMGIEEKCARLIVGAEWALYTIFVALAAVIFYGFSINEWGTKSTKTEDWIRIVTIAIALLESFFRALLITIGVVWGRSDLCKGWVVISAIFMIFQTIFYFSLFPYSEAGDLVAPILICVIPLIYRVASLYIIWTFATFLEESGSRNILIRVLRPSDMLAMNK